MNEARRVLPVSASPPEALRLLAELSEDLVREAGPSAREPVETLKEAARSRDLPGILWVGPKDEAVGIVWWEPPTEVGRRAGAYLAEGYRSDAALDGLLSAAEAAPGGPLVELADRIPGLLPQVRHRVLPAHGFVPVSRIDLGWPSARAPPAGPSPALGRARPLTAADAPALARLLDRAYDDNPVDLALFRRRSDRALDAADAVHYLLSGGLGPWLDSASFGVELGDEMIGATIANDYLGSLISEVMVDPRHRRRGLARHLLSLTLSDLLQRGRSDIRLVVTLSNARAYRLYTSMGFSPLPQTEGSIWLHAGRLGLLPTSSA